MALSRADLWEKALYVLPSGLWGIRDVWREYWKLLKDESG